jgi:hypothetical protein
MDREMRSTPLAVLVFAALAPAADLPLPPLTTGQPAAGKRVAVTAPEYAGTQVHHLVALPSDWNPQARAQGKRWPVIVEYTGNLHPASGSTGEVEGAALGHGLSRGQAIWIVLPYVAADRRRNEVTWWGDVAATVAYAKQQVPRICAEYGGDPRQVLLCGFSRGAIAVSYLGLHDDEIARLWCGFWAHDHFDGTRSWSGQAWSTPLARYREESAARLKRLQGRPLLVTQGIAGTGTREFLTPLLPPSAWTCRDIDMVAVCGAFPNPTAKDPHNDRWLLRDSPAGEDVRRWWAQVLADTNKKPR